MGKDSKSITLGFIHVRSTGNGAYRAGYLLTSEFAAPIEFHYTSEVRVTPQQRLLHGRRFEAILFGEILAKPMTDRQSRAPQVIVVDQAPLLSLRKFIPAPVVWVAPRDGVESAAGVHGRQAADDAIAGALDDSAGALSVQVDPAYAKDAAVFQKVRGLLAAGFDWLEPFERIAAALAEIREPSIMAA